VSHAIDKVESINGNPRADESFNPVSTKDPKQLIFSQASTFVRSLGSYVQTGLTKVMHKTIRLDYYTPVIILCYETISYKAFFFAQSPAYCTRISYKNVVIYKDMWYLFRFTINLPNREETTTKTWYRDGS
jgi:hypothetical protein